MKSSRRRRFGPRQIDYAARAGWWVARREGLLVAGTVSLDSSRGPRLSRRSFVGKGGYGEHQRCRTRGAERRRRAQRWRHLDSLPRTFGACSVCCGLPVVRASGLFAPGHRVGRPSTCAAAAGAGPPGRPDITGRRGEHPSRLSSQARRMAAGAFPRARDAHGAQFLGRAGPTMAQMQLGFFMANLSRVGAALLIAYFGAGPLSLDARAIRLVEADR